MRLRVGRRTKRNIWKGALAGLAAGIAGAVAMEQFQKAWLKVAGGNHPTDSSDPATVNAARTFSKYVLHWEIREDQKAAAGEIAHYAVGALSGAAYGGMAEVSAAVRAGAGSAYGAGLFVLNDEVIVPAAGWSKAPAAYPVSTHVYALASHVVYGLATEGTRRLIRSVI
jgi:putative membrane protein